LFEAGLKGGLEVELVLLFTLRAQHLILDRLLDLHDIDVGVVPHIFLLELFQQVAKGPLVLEFGQEGREGREHGV